MAKRHKSKGGMSLRTGGLLSWRSTASEPKPRSFTLASSLQPSMQPIAKKHPTPASPGPRLKPIVLAEEKAISFVCELRPSPRQLMLLDSLFAGPATLRALLLKATSRPKTAAEASLFLLASYDRLKEHLYGVERESSLNLLKNLVLMWSTDVPETVEIEFGDGCSVSLTQHLFFPLRHLGLIEVRDPEALRERLEGHTWSRSFSIQVGGRGYEAVLEFAARHQSVEVSSSGADTPVGARRRAGKSATLKSGKLTLHDILNMFDSRIQRSLRNELRVSQGFSGPDFNALEGRAVSGGLPSLGKRR